MNPFLVREKIRSPFEHCGRMLIHEGHPRIIIDGWAMFDISREGAGVVVFGLGNADICELQGEKAGYAWLSESGKGFYCKIRGQTFSLPKSRVISVLSGKHKKAAVFRVLEKDTSDTTGTPDTRAIREILSER